MKGILVLPALLILVIITKAQPGDFQLKHLEQRPFTKLSANPRLKGSGLNLFLVGRNYRNEWIDSIEVPVLNLNSDFDGLTPVKEGGGKQTHTLHIKDGNGYEWVLRSVQKFPEKVIAPELKGTIAEKIIRDGISASYPYSVLSVGTLASAAGVPYLPNTVVYIPDDPKLGEFRSRYKNTISLFELRTVEDNKKVKTFDTYEIVPGLQKSGNKKVDQRALLKARLLDNFIMDFDRYEAQWLWVQKDSAGQTFYYPIPKDRDQAFFNADGFLPKHLSKKPPLGPIQGFRAKPKNILTFNYSARNVDRAFLNELDEQTWASAIDQFLTAMTDSVIEDALKKQPKEIQKYHSEKIIAALKDKRALFKEEMMNYYRFISRTVSIVGTNDAERFTITKNNDNTVTIEVKNLNNSIVTYKRVFDPSVTKEIRVYGLEGDDKFLISGESSPIKIRLIGGPGEDIFSNTSKGRKVFVYDVSFEKNIVVDNGIRNKISNNPLNNEYRRLGTEYNSSSLGIFPEYFTDGGLFLGLSYKATTTGFRKEPYASKHLFYATRALSNSAYHLHYDADFTLTGSKSALLFRSDAKLPTIRTHFFGFGNNTVFDKNKSKGADYYRTQYTLIDASVLMRHSPTSWFQLQYGPSLQYFKISSTKNDNKFIGTVYPPEFNTPVYHSKWYAGGEIRAVINTKNNQMIPTRGVYATVYMKPLFGMGDAKNNLNQTGSDIAMYTDAIFKNHIILATAFGVHHNFGNFEIPQAQYLGFKQNLRGFRYQRFAGKTRAYNNSELRINFGDVNFYLFKGPFGILGFHDIGRVWTEGETSDTWHRGYGGGIWLAPFSRFVVAASLGASEEEKALPLVSFGFQF